MHNKRMETDLQYHCVSLSGLSSSSCAPLIEDGNLDYIALFKEPIFWALTTLGSVVLSVIANIVTPKVQELLSRHSTKRAARLREKNEETLMALVTMQKSGTFRTSWKIDSVLEAMHGIGIMLLALAFATIVPLIPFWEIAYFSYPLIAIFALFGFKKIQSGIAKSNLSKLADKRTTHLLRVHRKELDFLSDKSNKGKENPYSTNNAMKEWDEKHFGFSSDSISNQSVIQEFIMYL